MKTIFRIFAILAAAALISLAAVWLVNRSPAQTRLGGAGEASRFSANAGARPPRPEGERDGGHEGRGGGMGMLKNLVIVAVLVFIGTILGKGLKQIFGKTPPRATA